MGRRHPVRGLVSPHDSSEVEILVETCHLADFSQVLPFSAAKRGPPEDGGEPSLLPILFLCGQGQPVKLEEGLFREKPGQLDYESYGPILRAKE